MYIFHVSTSNSAPQCKAVLPTDALYYVTLKKTPRLSYTFRSLLKAILAQALDLHLHLHLKHLADYFFPNNPHNASQYLTGRGLTAVIVPVINLSAQTVQGVIF